MPKFIDVHTHVQFAAYDDSELVIDRAIKNDTWLINVGTQKDTSLSAVKTAEKYSEGVYAAIGLHPIHTSKSYHDVKELGGGDAAKEFTSRGEEFDSEFYEHLGRSEKVVAVGECGLDYYRLSEETKTKQFKAFESQIHLAHSIGKPLMIHCREAFNDLAYILGDHSKLLLQGRPGIIHFFAGTIPDAKRLMELGFSFSFGGVTTFVRDYDEVIKYIGLGRIVLETDAPYVTPVPFRGKRNEPEYVKYIAESIGKILGVDPETVARETTENARRIFKI